MRYRLNLTGNKFLEMEYQFVSTAALRVPENVESELSMLIYSFMFHHPEEYPDFCAALPASIQAHIPAALYYRGWAKLTFEGVSGGNVEVYPYEPRFPPGDRKPMRDAEGKPMLLSRKWPTNPSQENIDYHLECCLEQPFGGLRLCVVSTGNVTLSVDPEEFVLACDVYGHPEMGFDETRQSLLDTIQ